jgi:hypothetical protein
MKTLRRNFVEIVLLLSVVLWLVTIAITPVGGWHESNPHHEDYKFAFLASNLIVFGSLVLLFATSNSKRHD